MSLVAAKDLSLAYGPRVLLDGAAFAIGPHDRIGLVGANGTGKSSLMRILAGQIGADAGELTFRRGARVGYLPQDVAALPDLPLVEAVLASVPGRSALEERLAQAHAGLAAARSEAEQLELAGALAELHDELDHFEEHYGRRRAERILGGLGFQPADGDRPARTLSGGWKMRAALAGLLLQDPDLLLLDEPTNHLDVPTLTWFDGFLRASRKALLLVSHDRDFLNRQIDRVLSLEVEGLRTYAGNYDEYRRLRAEEEERLLAQAERQEAKRAQLERFIERFGAKATKARQAKSKEKLLEKMDEVQTLEHRDTLRFHFAEAPRSGKEVLRLEGVRKAFGQRIVYRSLDGAIQRGERIGVIGPNGAGKSTLLKLAAGEARPDAGEVKLGHSVVLGYYAQHHFEKPEHAVDGTSSTGTLDPDRTILDTLWDLVPDRGEAYVRSVAGSFLFSGDDVEKKVGVLSGGERARVALAKLLLVPANLLVMDEPTNHLDLDSSEALIDALRGYDGTLLFVSHNRSFLNQLATVIWEVKDGGILPSPGNLDDWLYHQRQLEAAAAGDAAAAPGNGAPAARGGGAVASPPMTEKERRRAEAEARNARARREKPVRDEIARLEAEIARLEGEERETTAALADPALYQDFARAKPLIERQAAAKAALEKAFSAWEDAQARLEAMQGAELPGA
ncbi:ABC-F family ATP-binding cassette domain-containing protein [Anaeromyxobacter oryzae]|uniref:Glycosyl transferase family 1 n=1 Tax=Anaeromyxobacter oryzae TaxID=2918170 RepID=A0ABM7WY95_9BACT|nr:ABC-F family ATP-binding cassette domain-containing protein [Anaeromyxobacter oryzae]BDG04501.1 glycosyl transferase family 1 [Anaeromyxobacter oryzae]